MSLEVILPALTILPPVPMSQDELNCQPPPGIGVICDVSQSFLPA